MYFIRYDILIFDHTNEAKSRFKIFVEDSQIYQEKKPVCTLKSTGHISFLSNDSNIDFRQNIMVFYYFLYLY